MRCGLYSFTFWLIASLQLWNWLDDGLVVCLNVLDTNLVYLHNFSYYEDYKVGNSSPKLLFLVSKRIFHKSTLTWNWFINFYQINPSISNRICALLPAYNTILFVCVASGHFGWVHRASFQFYGGWASAATVRSYMHPRRIISELWYKGKTR